HLRVARAFRPEHLNGDLSIEHDVNAMKDGPHPPFAELFRDLVISDYVSDHVATSISRVCRISLFDACAVAATERTAALMLSYPPRCLASAIRFSQAECGSPPTIASLISQSLTRS